MPLRKNTQSSFFKLSKRFLPTLAIEEILPKLEKWHMHNASLMRSSSRNGWVPEKHNVDRLSFRQGLRPFNCFGKRATPTSPLSRLLQGRELLRVRSLITSPQKRNAWCFRTANFLHHYGISFLTGQRRSTLSSPLALRSLNCSAPSTPTRESAKTCDSVRVCRLKNRHYGLPTDPIDAFGKTW